MSYDQVWEHLPKILSGLLITFELLFGAVAIGLILATFMAFISQSKYKWLKMPFKTFTFIIRGTPLLVQMYLIYYGTGQFEWIRNSFIWPIFKEPFYCALLALSLNTSAYTTELIRGAFLAIPIEEIEACKAVGMTRWTMLKHIVMPRAMRIMLPAYANEVIMVLKGTTLVSTITLLDLMGVIRQIISHNYQSIDCLLIAGVVYITINSLIVTSFKAVENRWNAYL